MKDKAPRLLVRKQPGFVLRRAATAYADRLEAMIIRWMSLVPS